MDEATQYFRFHLDTSVIWCVPFIREGYNIHLPNVDLYVAKSCSGIRYLISYFVFGLAYAFIYKKSINLAFW